MVAVLYVLALVSFALMGVFLLGLTLYSRLAAKQGDVDATAAALGARLDERHALIPEVERLVGGHLRYQPGVLDRLTALQRRPFDGQSIAERLAVDGQTAGEFAQVLSLARDVPALTESEAFAPLRRSMSEVDANVAAACRACDAAVREYHAACDTFPSSLVARLARLERRPPVEFAGQGAGTRAIRAG
jgi:LemA protein